jgi:hypothetical protein
MRQISVILCCATALTAGAQSGRTFVLMSPKGDVQGSFVVRDSSIFTRVLNESGWMSPSRTCMIIEGHAPVVVTPAQQQKWFEYWLDSTRAIRASTEPPPGVMTTLTADTQTIAGVRTRRLRMDSPAFQSSVWVAVDEVPSALRAANKWFVDQLPPDYWRRIHGSPGFTEIITLYGIPMRVQGPDGTTLDARAPTSTIPAWVADVEARCKHAQHQK